MVAPGLAIENCWDVFGQAGGQNFLGVGNARGNAWHDLSIFENLERFFLRHGRILNQPSDAVQ